MSSNESLTQAEGASVITLSLWERVAAGRVRGATNLAPIR